MWPDLAKFRHFGKSFPVFGKFLTVYFLFGKILSWLWQICDVIGLILIVANGQILKNNLTIWSSHVPDDALLVIASLENPRHAELDIAVAAEKLGQEGGFLRWRWILGSLLRGDPFLLERDVLEVNFFGSTRENATG